jgi:hypothetical protein
MKKFLSIALLALCATSHLLAQAPGTEWSRRLVYVNQSPGVAPTFDTHTDKFGNITVCGYFGDTMLLHDGTLLVSDPGVYSTFLARYDDAGNHLWSTVIRQTPDLFSNYEGQANICVDGAGNTYLTGLVLGPIADLGNGITVARSCTDSCVTTFTAKFDINGKAIWANTVKVGDSTYVISKGLEVNDKGQLFMVAHHSAHSLDFGTGFAFDSLYSYNFFAVRYDATTGAPQAVRFFGSGSTNSFVDGADINDEGLLAVHGLYYGDFDFGNGVSLSQVNGNDHFVMVMDENLVPHWARNLNSEYYMLLLDIDISNSGNVYLAIDFSYNLRLGELEVLLAPQVEYSTAILKLQENDLDIPVFIPYNFGGFPLSAVTTDKAGNFYAGGYFSDSISLQVGGQAIQSHGCYDHFVMKGNADGNILWAEALGVVDCETMLNLSGGNTLSVDSAGNLYVVGAYFEAQNVGNGISVTKYKSGTSGVGSSNALVPDLRIRPNPAQDAVQVVLGTALRDDCQLIVTNLAGQVVERKTIRSGTDQLLLNTERFANGCYVVQILAGRQQGCQQKLVITR